MGSIGILPMKVVYNRFYVLFILFSADVHLIIVLYPFKIWELETVQPRSKCTYHSNM